MLKDLVIDYKSKSKASEQIGKYIRRRIQSGDLSPGDKLPSTLEFMQSLRVGPKTVSSAVSELAESGLVKAIPGKGIFVASNQIKLSNSIPQSISTALTSICVFGHFNEPEQGGWLKKLAIGGILKQSNILGVKVSFLPEKVFAGGYAAISKELIQMEVNGVLWLLPRPEHWELIEKINDEICKVVVARESHGKDKIACVESDYSSAGYNAAELFIEQNCTDFVFFSRKIPVDVQKKHGLWPTDIGVGLRSAIHKHRNISEDMVREIPLGGDYDKSPEIIQGIIKDIEAHSGIFFVDPMHFISYMNTYDDDALDTLKSHVVAMIVNSDNYHLLSRFGSQLNLYGFMDKGEKKGELAVQILANVVSGFLENTSVVIKLEMYKA
jgi:DNA-binding transcriptional regulator YhcF (GntR family)